MHLKEILCVDDTNADADAVVFGNSNKIVFKILAVGFPLCFALLCSILLLLFHVLMTHKFTDQQLLAL